MAHKNKVLLSVNLDGEFVCVDLFVRPDGTYGYGQFRRDPEDGRGWYPIGHDGAAAFTSYDAALADALATIHWLADALAD